MNLYRFSEIIVYLMCFGAALFACSSIQFDKICHANQVTKIRLLLLLLSMAVAYLCAQFLFIFTTFN